MPDQLGKLQYRNKYASVMLITSVKDIEAAANVMFSY